MTCLKAYRRHYARFSQPLGLTLVNASPVSVQRRVAGALPSPCGACEHGDDEGLGGCKRTR